MFKESALKAYWDKVELQKGNPCWLWTGHHDEKGYGRIAIQHGFGTASVHRIAWVLEFGELRDCDSVKHLCKNLHCVNPYHLTLGVRKYTEENFWEWVSMQHEDYCWHWIGPIDKLGYGIAGREKAHRLAWIYTYGPIPDRKQVLHKCDNRPCCNPDHLFLGTPVDNVQDCVNKDRRAEPMRGESNPKSKLTWELIDEIRASYPRLSTLKLGKLYGVDHKTIWRIVNNKAWKEEWRPSQSS